MHKAGPHSVATPCRYAHPVARRHGRAGNRHRGSNRSTTTFGSPRRADGPGLACGLHLSRGTPSRVEAGSTVVQARSVADGEQQKWPDTLWIVRHGESAGNVAREAAYRSGLARIDLDVRDVDVPLSALGEQQARALGRWFGGLPPDDRPSVVLSSPYLRAARTVELICQEAGLEFDDVSFTR